MNRAYRDEYARTVEVGKRFDPIIRREAGTDPYTCEMNRLIEIGRIVPMLYATLPLDLIGQAARLTQTNQHIGKVDVRCPAPEQRLSATDPDLRVQVGKKRLRVVRSA